MIPKLQDLQQAIYTQIVHKQNISPQELSKLQTIIFLQNLQDNAELEKSYYQIVKNHIDSNKSIHEGELETLLRIVYYLGIFIDQEYIFTKAFKIIKENLLDHSPIIHNPLYLQVLQACGSSNIQMKSGFKFVNIDNNQYFIDRFLTPYIEELIKRVPQENIIEFIEEEQQRISKLHPQSMQYIIHELKLYIINQQLSKVNFDEQNIDLFQLFSYLQQEDRFTYKLKQKLDEQNKKENEINSFYRLALLYKSYLKMKNIVNFNEFIQFFQDQSNLINQVYKNEKHLLIALNEYVEEYLSERDVTTNLLECENEILGQLTQCMIQSTDHFISKMIYNLFKLVSPFKMNFNFQIQIQKVKLMAQYHHRQDEQLKLRELNKYLILAQQQLRPLYLPFTNFIPQVHSIIQKVPQQLLKFLPFENEKKKIHLTHYGYAEVIYTPQICENKNLNQFTLILSTIQLVTLCSLENGELDCLDEKSMKVFLNIGLVNEKKQIVQNWLPKHKTMILYI